MSPPIYTPDGTEVSEIVLPDGSTASEVIGPDGNVVFEAPPDIPASVVDNFEDGDITISLKDNWSGWSGDTGAFSAQQTTVLEGDWSATLSAPSGTAQTVDAIRDTADTPSEIKTLLQVTQRNGDPGDGTILRGVSGGTRFFRIRLVADGGIQVNGNSKSGSWSLNTTYRLRAYNIDFSNDQFDWEVIDQSDGTTISSNSGEAFENSVSSADTIRLVADGNSGAGDQNGIYDLIEWVQ